MPPFVCAPYAVLIIAVLLAYANVYRNEFLFDDLILITNNKFITSWRYIGTLFVTSFSQGGGHSDPFYRPLVQLLYLIVYQTAGPSTFAFHLLNVVLHILNACLLYTLGIKLDFKPIAAFMASLLWAVHPVQTEAVAYMSDTTDLLCGVFILSGSVLALGDNRCRVLWVCLSFALALFSKETAVVVPLLVMGLLFYRSEDRWSLRTYLNTWPLWLMVGAYLAARATVLNFAGVFGYYNNTIAVDVGLAHRFYTSLATLPVYTRLLVWPVGLHMERSFPIYTSLWAPQVLEGFLILATVITCILWKPTCRTTPMAWGLVWAAAMHAPQSGILIRSDALIAEHWLYLPTMGLSLGFGESLERMSQSIRMARFRPVLAGLAALTACLFGTMTFEQNKIWKDSFTFYNHIFACGDDSIRARVNLSDYYYDRHQFDLALEQARLALRMSDDYAPAHFFYGLSLIRLDTNSQTIDEGMKHFQRALAIDPEFYLSYDAMADVYDYLGDLDKESQSRAKSAEIKKKLGLID